MNLGINRNVAYNTSFKGVSDNIDFAKLHKSFNSDYINNLTVSYDALKKSDVVDLIFKEDPKTGRYKSYLVLKEDVGGLKKGTKIRGLINAHWCDIDDENTLTVHTYEDEHCNEKNTFSLRFRFSELMDKVLEKIPGVKKKSDHDYLRVDIGDKPSLGVLLTYAKQLEELLNQIDTKLDGMA